MDCLEFEQALTGIIRDSLDVIDELYAVLSQHIGTEAAGLPCIEKMHRISENMRKLKLDREDL